MSTVALVFGGASPEHDVSLVSAKGILEHLRRDGRTVILVGVDREGRPRVGDEALLTGGLDRGEGKAVSWPSHAGDRTLRDDSGAAVTPPIDVAFPIIHGEGGEDGVLQGVFEWAGIPYVGAGVLGSALAMDKDLARRVMMHAGLPVVRDVVLDAGTRISANEIVERLGLPLFVKPARAGSSVGISKVTAVDQLDAAIDHAREIDEKVVIEEAVVDAREIELAVLGNEDVEVSIPGEIAPHGEFYSYESKYDDPLSELHIPAPIDDVLTQSLRAHARNAYIALGLRGMARVDFLVSRTDGRVVLNEVNTLPGFTPISMYPRLWEATGIPYAELLDRLIELARLDQPSKPSPVNRR